MVDYTKHLENYINAEIKTLRKLPLEDISSVMNILENARLNGKNVFIFGNGGSGATASHFVCDFNKGVSLEQEIKYNFECLNDNVPMMMAISNDISYNEIFVEQLKNKLKNGDVVIGISGSGNSENVCRAIDFANKNGAVTIGLCGYSGGKLKEISQYNIHVNINNMQIVEDIHMSLDHMMMFILSGKTI